MSKVRAGMSRDLTAPLYDDSRSSASHQRHWYGRKVVKEPRKCNDDTGSDNVKRAVKSLRVAYFDRIKEHWMLKNTVYRL